MSTAVEAPVRSWVPAYLLLTPVGVALVRLVLGASTLLIISAVTRTPLPPRRTWRHLVALAVVLLAFPEEQPTHERTAGLAVGFAGVVLVLGLWRGLATGQTVVGTLLLVPAAAVTGVVAILRLGCLGTGVAYVLNFVVVARAGGTIASTVAYLTPVVAVTVGVALLGEGLRWNEPVGALVVVAGAALAQDRVRRWLR